MLLFIVILFSILLSSFKFILFKKSKSESKLLLSLVNLFSNSSKLISAFWVSSLDNSSFGISLKADFSNTHLTLNVLGACPLLFLSIIKIPLGSVSSSFLVFLCISKTTSASWAIAPDSLISSFVGSSSSLESSFVLFLFNCTNTITGTFNVFANNFICLEISATCSWRLFRPTLEGVINWR